MKNYLRHDPWKIIEEGFHPEFNEISESCFAIGNGMMGQRANFEEQFTGLTLQGNYLAGVFFPDDSGVKKDKTGYPEFFAKVLNAPNWTGIDIFLDGEALDLATCKVKGFRRVLDLKTGVLERSFTAKLVSGKEIKVKATRFCSMANPETGAIRYSVKPLNFEGTITVKPYIDGDVWNRDSGTDENFWKAIDQQVKKRSAYVVAETKRSGFRVCTGMKFKIAKNKQTLELTTTPYLEEKYAACSTDLRCKPGDELVVFKYAAVVSSFYREKTKLQERCQSLVRKAFNKGFDKLLKKHAAAWAGIWDAADVVIEGDVAAQQAIRFNIFHLFQTYNGNDARLNIGPKGFTGEKYGGSTRWDSEAFCLPFYMATAGAGAARNLLLYRYHHLPKAIENAVKMGFTNGAALYPMETMTGEECHSEWETTFQAIHRNGAVAYAIFDYLRYTGDLEYLIDFGLEVLIAIARFWAQRVHWAAPKERYVLHGVTGPNEYENNADNNWYTNYLAVWCLRFTMEALQSVAAAAPEKYAALRQYLSFDENTETARWVHIIEKMYFPTDERTGLILQQENFLDKELRTVADLPPDARPLHQNWTWDRILRSCFIKQADVLQGLYFFENDFGEDQIRLNFNFYEPMTVHESSLSAGVHAILAARLGLRDKALELFRRSVRLDLDDYNDDTHNGLHITGMAGAWLALVKGIGGMRTGAEGLSFDPFLPENWTGYTFKIMWRGSIVRVQVSEEGVQVANLSEQELTLWVKGRALTLPPGGEAKA